MQNIKSNVNNKLLLSGTAALLLSVSSPTLIAQEVNSAVNDKKGLEITEVIEVSGVRASLENALNVKREAASIVDAISATDIDALPALDLGDALQAIPGVQLNAETEGRQSTISLRGLSSGFVKTTAFGQSFATPTPAGGNRVGAPNPFSAFEAGIFDGVTVVKSPTADLQEGGLAGTVDKKLQQALSKKDGTATISLGVSHEALPKSYNPQVRLSGVKHLIEDKLAVAFKLAYSKQEFRRDTFDIIDYVSAEDVTNAGQLRRNTNGGQRATNIAEYREFWNVPDDAEIRVPLRGRNVTQYSVGDRLSFSGNIEYRPTDDLKVGAHVLISARDLDDGTKETTNYQIGLHNRNAGNDFHDSQVTLDLDVAPFAYTPLTADGTGGDAYIAPAISFQNGRLQNENRKTTFDESTNGVMLYADYVADDWVFDGVVSYSEAENRFTNIGVGYNHQGNRNASQTPSGFNGYINTGSGELNDIVVTGGLEVPYVYDGVWNDEPLPITVNGASVLHPLNQGRRLSTYVNGRTRDLVSDFTSGEFNAQRYTDFGFGDGLRFDSIKFGGRLQIETIESIDQVNGLGGVNLSNLSSDLISTNTVESQQTPFFNGNIPGTFDSTNGWVTVDNDLTIAALQTNLITDRTQLPLGDIDSLHPSVNLNRAGFWDRARSPGGQAWLLDTNYDVEQEINALYVTTDFSGELTSDVTFTGNFGVRYVETNNTFDGVQLGEDIDGNFTGTPINFKDSYSNTLPMANLSFELSEDVVLRTAYYKGIVRPNINSQRPAPSLREGNNTVSLDIPNATLEPYEADNYDVSLEWYNREGSAISLGYFKKDISNLFGQEDVYCPTDGSDSLVNDLVGAIELVGEVCQQVEFFTPPLQGVENEIDPEPRQRQVDIDNPVNSDETLSVEGFELAIQQKLDFLPYPWNGFGGVFNYTKIKQTGAENQLSRVSPQSFNVITYYENDGLSLRFAYNWRDDQQTAGANGFLGTGTRTIKARGRLDFSGSYKINKKTKVFLRGINLTDEITVSHYGFNEDAIHQLSYGGRVWQASVNYRF